jgi:hypothetical protein
MQFLPRSSKRGWRNRELVRETDHRRIRNLWMLLLGIVAAAAPLAVYLVEQIQYVHVRYQIESVRKEHQRFLEAERRFRIQRATLECPPRVEARAKNLGLIHPAPDQVVIVSSEDAAMENLMARAPDENAMTP